MDGLECREWSAQITDGDLLCLYGRRKVTSVIGLGVCSPRFCSQLELVLFLWMPNPSASSGLGLGEDGEAQLPWQDRAVALSALLLSHPKPEREEDTTTILFIGVFFFFSKSLKSKHFPGINECISTTRCDRRKSNFLVRDWQQRYTGLRDRAGPTGSLGFRMRTNP